MENGPLDDVFPIKNGDIPASYVSLPEGTWYMTYTPICMSLTWSVADEKTTPARETRWWGEGDASESFYIVCKASNTERLWKVTEIRWMQLN